MKPKDLFGNLFGSEEPTSQEQGNNGAEGECQHLVLLPRWDSVDDMGNEEKIVGYDCNTCKASFTLKEAENLRRRHHAIKL